MPPRFRRGLEKLRGCCLRIPCGDAAKRPGVAAGGADPDEWEEQTRTSGKQPRPTVNGRLQYQALQVADGGRPRGGSRADSDIRAAESLST